MRPFKLACIQIGCPTADKEANLNRAIERIKEAAKQNAQVVLLPEYCCLRIFDKESAVRDAEDFGVTPSSDFNAFDVSKSPSQTLRTLSRVASETKVWLFAGSYPELSNGRIYNCMPVFNPKGHLVATYRKTHLCDLPMMNNTKESDFIETGDQFINVTTEFGVIACAICYDIRFAPLATIAAKRRADLILYPAYFPRRTGELHWELLQRARALDNTLWVATCGRAEDRSIAWDPYGCSMVTNPLGQVVARAEGPETILYAEIDPAAVRKARDALGVESGSRFDLYSKYM